MRLLRFLLLALALAAPARAAEPAPKVHIVAFGLWEAQNVFGLEATRGAAVLARDYGAGSRQIVRFNRPHSAAASPRALQQALRQTAARMDLERDVLFLLLTSHGSQEGIAVQIGGRTAIMPPAMIGDLLNQAGIKRRVVIVSACYSGVFADALADANTLVITAADGAHPSFGCTNTARWTYFGEAFFAHALRQTSSLTEAFAIAKREVAAREAKEGFDPSNPQIRGGSALLPALEAGRR